ncbi:MAG: hypothetical protein OXC71_07625 [Chloroflexi bacterium]|nr:hypothetical protein [Chloroflexota bacterium]
MHKRTLLATATLTALLLTVGSLQTAPTGVETELAPHASGLQTMQAAEAPAGPQWGEAFGWGLWWGIAGAITCSAFSGPGGIACGIAAAA